MPEPSAPASAEPAPGAPRDSDLSTFGAVIGLLFFTGLIGWAFINASSEVFRILTTGSNCPKRHCTSWAEDPGTLKVTLIGSGLFALFSGALLLSGLWALLFGPPGDKPTTTRPARPAPAKPRRRGKRR